MSIKIDFEKMTGKIKPMNAVNNGPAAMSVRGDSNFDLFQSCKHSFYKIARLVLLRALRRRMERGRTPHIP